jgi:hypothetical protein
MPQAGVLYQHENRGVVNAKMRMAPGSQYVDAILKSPKYEKPQSHIVLPPSVILFANIDVSRYILVVDTSVLTKSNIDQREYHVLKFSSEFFVERFS